MSKILPEQHSEIAPDGCTADAAPIKRKSLKGKAVDSPAPGVPASSPATWPAEIGNKRLSAFTRDQLLELLDKSNEGGIRINFDGKSGARRLARLVRPRTARNTSKLGHGDANERSNNLLIEGDNLQGMVTLYKERGHVDLILTDPPYNTGIDFRYNDRWDDDPNDSGLGEFVSAEDGARHTKWMRFMWPRLQMMKSMLKPSGILAICIDHRELFRLGQMLDELFGEQNRLAIINWQRSYTPTNDAEHVATTTEYVLIYAKASGKATTRLLPRNETKNLHRNPDSDPLPWVDGPATGSNAKAHKSMVYAIQSPFTGDLLYPPAGSAWRQGQDRNLEQIQGWGSKYKLKNLNDAEKRASLIGISVDEVPAVQGLVLAEPLSVARKRATKILNSGVWPRLFFLAKGQGRPRLKKYVSELQEGFVPTTYWASDEIEMTDQKLQPVDAISWPHEISGHSQQGVRELTDVVGEGHEFKTVKPMKLFSKIIKIWSSSGALILDPFAGSGTTGHAVLSMNKQDGGNRRFILIEQGRPERGDSYASTLTADRLKRVCTGNWAKGKHPPLGGGFGFLRLGKSVDASALLIMERDEMLDTVIASHFDSSRRRANQLIRIEETKKPYRYLVAKNADNEGFFLIWSGPEKNTDFTESVYEICADEAERAGLKPSPYHVYARLYRYQTDGVRFYQIPDRILSDFGLDMRSEPFTSEEGGEGD